MFQIKYLKIYIYEYIILL
eukprot:UN09133